MRNWLLSAITLVIVLTLVPLSEAELLAPETTSGITLNFQNTDIDLVLKFFSDTTGRPFIKSDAVRCFVTLLSPGRVSVPDAYRLLQDALELKGYVLITGSNNVTKVLTQLEAAQSGVEVGSNGTTVSMAAGDRMLTQVIPLKFITAQECKNEVGSFISKSGTLVADDRLNALLVTDMASNIQRLIKIINNIDIRTPQVLIEALMLEVSLTDETKFGLEWSGQANFNTHDHNFFGHADQGFSIGSVITEGLKYAVIRDDNKFTALLQALSTNKDVNILSTPHIVALNNQTAVIRVGEEVPILTQTRNIQGGETIRSFDFKSVAIELEVTPRINYEREVFLKVHPLVKKILGFNAELNAPILASREAQTSVLVKDGQTVVIGGLMKDDRSSNESKIPLLGDIPILGHLFKRSTVTKEKTELLVFITPRVIGNPDEARRVTQQKEAESTLPQAPDRKKANDLYRLGCFYARHGKRNEAISSYEQASRLAPDEKMKRKITKKKERVLKLKQR